MKLSKVDAIFLASIGLLLLLSLYLWANPEAGRWLSLAVWRSTVEGLRNKDLGTALLITIGITMLGNLSPFPSPYILAVFFLSLPPADPLFPAFVASVASIGALLGETVGYAIGAGIRKLAADAKKVQELRAVASARPRLVYFLIYFMAVTPLPDKVVMIPAGIAGFRFRYAILSMWLGKLTLLQAIAYGGYFIGEGALKWLGPEESWVSGVAAIFLILFIVYAIFRVDLGRFVKRPEGRSQ